MTREIWKELANTLEEVVHILPPPAGMAVKFMGKLASLTYSVLEAKGVSKRNQQLVEQLAERALIVSRMIELYVAQCRAQDQAFNTFVTSFHKTIEEVLGFVEKVVQKRGLDSILRGDEVRSQSADLWRRLDALAADYRGYLLKDIVSRGPAERIDHPHLREFWSLSMKNVFEAKWVHFWDQLLHDFPAAAQFLSGPLASHNQVKLQAKAQGDRQSSRDINKVGPWEINNLFQPPNTPVENIIGTVLADANYRASIPSMVVANASRPPKKRIRIETSTAEAREVQSWTGYWVRGCHRGVMTVELLVAANHRIYGGGERRGTKVRFIKQYIGQHHVAYDGAIKNTIIDGTWTKDIGPSRKGAFLLEQQLSWTRADTIATEIGLVQIGKMQRWTGYCVKRGRKLNMSVDIIFTETNKIFGGGEDPVGRFTWLGRYHPMSRSTLVSITKQYEEKYVVYYMGAVGRRLIAGREDLNVFMEGSWVSSNKLEHGTFCFQPEVHS